MALGYCVVCITLRPITKLGQQWGSRQCDWAPVDHNMPDTHAGCGSWVEWKGTEDDTWAECESCGLVRSEDVVESTTHCSGSRRPIR